jgi:hypothetical protein
MVVAHMPTGPSGFAAGSGTITNIVASAPIPDTGFRPSGAANTPVQVYNNGGWVTTAYGYVLVGTDGSIKVFRDLADTAFSARSNCAMNRWSLCWYV